MSFTIAQQAQRDLALEAATITAMGGVARKFGPNAALHRPLLIAGVLPLACVGLTYAAVTYASWVIAVSAVLIYVGWALKPLVAISMLSLVGEYHVQGVMEMLYAELQSEEAASKE